MSIEFVLAPKELDPKDIILICDHEPRENWTHFKKGEVVAVSDDGTETVADHMALCNICCDLPSEDIIVHTARLIKPKSA